MQDQLIFVISPPRSGSTLLQRMLAAHSQIASHPEPHLMSPIAHLGVYANIDKAPFDHINAAQAMRSFIQELPRKEDDYYDAVRAYCDTLYGRALSVTDQRYFVDKTPANALVLPFVERLYPQAHYVVLTRHPLAIMSSYANSFFNGDWQRAHDFNPILERYVPAIAKFLRESKVPRVHVKYEDLVRDPEAEMQRVLEFLGLNYEASTVEYGAQGKPMKEGMGDPITVNRQQRPVDSSLQTWAAELSADPQKLALARKIIAQLPPEDLKTWGWTDATLWSALQSSNLPAPPKPVWNAYTFQRWVMLALKKDIDSRLHGRLIRRVKYYCDVLLRP